MEQAKLEQIIEAARRNRKAKLKIIGNRLTTIPESIGNLSDLTQLNFSKNQLVSLPDSIENLVKLTNLNLSTNRMNILLKNIDRLFSLRHLNLYNNRLAGLPNSIENLSKLTKLNLSKNRLTSLPNSIGNLIDLTNLTLDDNRLTTLPDSIGNLSKLTQLNLENNQLTSLPDSIGSLSKLTQLNLRNNQLTNLPHSISNLSCLIRINLDHNPLTDLSMLQDLPMLETITFLNAKLPHRYWCKFTDWKVKWLLDEDNAEIRQILIKQLGYDRICAELNPINLDRWREYTLLKINGRSRMYDNTRQEIVPEPIMLLLKMTCPSTNHIHILRVPPQMTSAEAAITWINHGIHPDEFAIQT